MHHTGRRRYRRLAERTPTPPQRTHTGRRNHKNAGKKEEARKEKKRKWGGKVRLARAPRLRHRQPAQAEGLGPVSKVIKVRPVGRLGEATLAGLAPLLRGRRHLAPLCNAMQKGDPRPGDGRAGQRMKDGPVGPGEGREGRPAGRTMPGHNTTRLGVHNECRQLPGPGVPADGALFRVAPFRKLVAELVRDALHAALQAAAADGVRRPADSISARGSFLSDEALSGKVRMT